LAEFQLDRRDAAKNRHRDLDLRFHDLRASHETILLDKGVPVHVVAKRCGHDPAMLLRVYAKRTRKADQAAASVIETLTADVFGANGGASSQSVPPTPLK
jgi:integrase